MIRLTILICFLFSSVVLCIAQDTLAYRVTDSLHSLKPENPLESKKKPENNWNIFGELNLQSLNKPNYFEYISAGAGLQYKRWMTGGNLTLFIGNKEKTVIFPNEAQLVMVFGTVHAGYTIWKKDYLEVDLKVHAGGGDMLWEDTENFFNYFSSRFVILQPEAVFRLKPFRFFDVTSSFGYRHMDQLSIPYVTNADFSGLILSGGIRIVLWR